MADCSGWTPLHAQLRTLRSRHLLARGPLPYPADKIPGMPNQIAAAWSRAQEDSWWELLAAITVGVTAPGECQPRRTAG